MLFANSYRMSGSSSNSMKLIAKRDSDCQAIEGLRIALSLLSSGFDNHLEEGSALLFLINTSSLSNSSCTE